MLQTNCGIIRAPFNDSKQRETKEPEKTDYFFCSLNISRVDMDKIEEQVERKYELSHYSSIPLIIP